MIVVGKQGAEQRAIELEPVPGPFGGAGERVTMLPEALSITGYERCGKIALTGKIIVNGRGLDTNVFSDVSVTEPVISTALDHRLGHVKNANGGVIVSVIQGASLIRGRAAWQRQKSH